MLKLKLKKLKFFGEKIVKKNSGKNWERKFCENYFFKLKYLKK